MKIFINLIQLSLFFFYSSCVCDNYFVNSAGENIKGDYFSIECRRVQNPVQKDNDKLELTLVYKEDSLIKIAKSSLIILPILYKTGDTLELLSEYASVYTYSLNGESNLNLNLKINFNIDSAGVKISKVMFIQKLKKITKCRFRPVLH